MTSEVLTKLATYDDYRQMPDDGKQYQIIGGKLYMAPAPSILHQRISGNLYKILDDHVTRNGTGEVLFAPVDVILSMTDVVQPDLLFITSDRLNIITKKNIVAGPDLVVEILSEHTEMIDRKKKKELYERYGIKEYWIIAPEIKQIEQFCLEDQSLMHKTTAGRDGTLSSPIFNDFNLDISEIFD